VFLNFVPLQLHYTLGCLVIIRQPKVSIFIGQKYRNFVTPIISLVKNTEEYSAIIPGDVTAPSLIFYDWLIGLRLVMKKTDRSEKTTDPNLLPPAGQVYGTILRSTNSTS